MRKFTRFTEVRLQDLAKFYVETMGVSLSSGSSVLLVKLNPADIKHFNSVPSYNARTDTNVGIATSAGELHQQYVALWMDSRIAQELMGKAGGRFKREVCIEQAGGYSHTAVKITDNNVIDLTDDTKVIQLPSDTFLYPAIHTGEV